jgi:type IV pilus assembly protein PilZ
MHVESGGVFFATYQPMRIGNVVDMAVTLPDAKEPITVSGVVRWTRPHLEGSDGAAGIGIKFLDLTSEGCARVEEFARARPPMVFELDDPPIRRRGKAA